MNERHHGLGQGIGFAILYAVMYPFVKIGELKDKLKGGKK